MIKILKYFYKSFNYGISTYISAFLITCMYSVTVILSPIASQYLINKVLYTENIDDLKTGIFIFLIACLVQPLIGLIRDIIFIKMNFKIKSSVSKTMFNKIIKAKVSFFDSCKNGDIISRITNDGSAISDFVSSVFVVYVKDVLLLVSILIGMCFMSVKITVLIVLLLLLNLMIGKFNGKKFKRNVSNIVKNNDNIISFTNQAITSIMTIKSFSNEDKVSAKYSELMDSNISINQKNQLLNVYMNNFNDFIGIFSLSIIYGFGALEILNQNISIGSVIGLGLYFQLIISPLNELINNNIKKDSIMPMYERVKQYLSLEEEDYRADSLLLKDNEQLSLNNVSFSYGNKKVFNCINIIFPEKGLSVVKGESGTGKSTLIKLILRFYDPSSGCIYIGDKEYKEIDVNTLRNYIGLVSQDTVLFNMSIKDNIRLVNPSITDEEIVELCKKVNIHDNISSFELGYDTVINEKINLSGGEKQRLYIAMVLARKAKILILDEPTSALDVMNSKIILDIIRDISKDKLVILITHKDDVLEYADEVFDIQNLNMALRGE